MIGSDVEDDGIVPEEFRTTECATVYWREHVATPALVDEYLQSQYDPPRTWVLKGLTDIRNVSSVLELGCHCGPLLARLSASGYAASGIDANPGAVAAAVLRGCSARVGVLPQVLGDLADKSVDVIMSSYCLAYLSPDDLPVALARLLTIARRGLVFVEPMAGPGVPAGFSGSMHGVPVEWRHDYFAALDAAVDRSTPRPEVQMTRYAKGPHKGVNGLVVVRL